VAPPGNQTVKGESEEAALGLITGLAE